MKNKTMIIATLFACALTLTQTGCKTTQTVTLWPDGTATTNTVTRIDPQRTTNAINAIITAGVKVAIATEPKASYYIAKVQVAVCTVANSGNLTPENLRAAVDATGIKELKAEEVQVAIASIYGIYQFYYGEVVSHQLNQSQWLVPVLQSICDSLSNGLALSAIPKPLFEPAGPYTGQQLQIIPIPLFMHTNSSPSSTPL
jgi:hypothetical protein